MRTFFICIFMFFFSFAREEAMRACVRAFGLVDRHLGARCGDLARGGEGARRGRVVQGDQGASVVCWVVEVRI